MGLTTPAGIRGRSPRLPAVAAFAAVAGLTRVCLGDGKNGMVRYIREEVIAYEQSRRVSLTL